MLNVVSEAVPAPLSPPLIHLRWTMLCAAGHVDAATASTQVLSGQLQVGAAVAVMFQLAALKSCGASHPHTRCSPADNLSAPHEPAALLQEACMACTRVVADSNERASLVGLENAFWMVQAACGLVALGVAQATYCDSGATDASGNSREVRSVPGASSTVNQEALSGHQEDRAAPCCTALHAGTEYMLACARAAHDVMVKHTDQNVCMSALKALKVRPCLACWPSTHRWFLANCSATSHTQRQVWRGKQPCHTCCIPAVIPVAHHGLC